MNKTERLLLALTEDELKRLESAANFEKVTKQEIVRRLIFFIPIIGYIQDGKVTLKEESK